MSVSVQVDDSARRPAAGLSRLQNRALAANAAREHEDRYAAVKTVAFVSVGIATLAYSLAELGVGVWFHALVLLSDGFHNLSDFLALAIGLWAARKSRQPATDEYSYGWARAELLGALVNSVFLLSLSFYILLEAVPRFIEPEPIPQHGFAFIIFASIGLGLNVTGAIVFACTGKVLCVCVTLLALV